MLKGCKIEILLMIVIVYTYRFILVAFESEASGKSFILLHIKKTFEPLR